ncbi:putative uncharacterized protein [Clostridium sp. CAG:411]|nr:SbcC/MukB-like Walker B domain-containing protein [Lachnospiraceae bacterium]CDE43452.1 putative uncharacterized protein [Clostridium sp. CAG:411]
MKAKKVFRRLCLTNWGGVDHTILEFNEYVNLFSGKSGSGKSTAMDALQVILYGSVSSNFLNRAADDKKNKRSVFGYLRGEQKDGTANREKQDFCSVIALEIEDVRTHTKNCVGFNFEVRSKDTELNKFVYFSHTGDMPEGGYLTKEGIPFTNAQMRELIEERERSIGNRGRAEINRIYNTKEAYLATLYQKILGGIDGRRFETMEKSAIALQMSNGTGQFIKDYMFPQGTGEAITQLSEQLGAYRDICERIEDIKKRIGLLENVQKAGIKLSTAKAEQVHYSSLIKCLNIVDAKDHIAAWQAEKETVDGELIQLKQVQEKFQKQEESINEQWTQAKADLQSSDLGHYKEHLEELNRRSEMLAANNRRWRTVTEGLKQWGEDDYINDYLSGQVLKKIDLFLKEQVTTEKCVELRETLLEEKKQLEKELGMLQEDYREIKKQLEERRSIVNDMKQDRKPYGAKLKKAQAELQEHLQYACGKDAKVFVLADLFDIQDAEWKNAVEGCMGKLRFALITEPKYAEEAARQFRKLSRHENIDLINAKALQESQPKSRENSLYETVICEKDYVDDCLKRFLGSIIKCQTEEEMIAAGNAITKDCYSYHNFMFRHLRKKDYEMAFIGTKVSKVKLGEYERELEKMEKRFAALGEQISHMKLMYDYEMLAENPFDYMEFSKAGTELEETMAEIEKLHTVIDNLEKGEFRELQQREEQLHKEYKNLRKQSRDCNIRIQEKTARVAGLAADIKGKEEELKELEIGYTENTKIKEEIRQEREKGISGITLNNRWIRKIKEARETEEEAKQERTIAREEYITNYPNSEFTGWEPDNEKYDRKLVEYQKNYEPQYQEEFEKQCSLIYKSLRDNVIAKIHGDIKAAHRHKEEINRLLRETNFADSCYQIDIEPADNADGQFYDMLMAEELDTKNPDNDGFEGQLSLGENAFYQKYEMQIKALMEKFMPAKNIDEVQLKKYQEEMNKYADYRTYLAFRMNEIVTDSEGKTIRKNYVDEMAGRDSGGEGQNPKYVALLAGFAMLYMSQTNRDSKIKLVLLDEAFSKMDQERSAVCLQYARKMDLQLIVCVPDERLQSLIRNVDSVYGFRRKNNRISMMHIDKGSYLKMMEGEEEHETITGRG